MSLSKIIAATGLTFFLLGSNFSKTFAEEKIKENEKYETLFLSDYGQGLISLEWDINKDKKEDLSGLYKMSPIEGLNGFFDLDLIGKKNNSEDEIKDEKYSRLLMMINQGGLIIGWYKYSKIDDFPEKQYYYQRIGFDEKKRGVHKLEAIQEDKNHNRKFEDEEFTYQSEYFKNMLSSETNK